MPYDLYWRGPLNALLIYAEKARLEAERENRIAWLNGAYVSRAIANVLDGKKQPYPKEPIRQLTPEQERKRQETADMIAEHNEQMRQIQEEQAIKLQKQLEAQMGGG